MGYLIGLIVIFMAATIGATFTTGRRRIAYITVAGIAIFSCFVLTDLMRMRHATAEAGTPARQGTP